MLSKRSHFSDSDEEEDDEDEAHNAFTGIVKHAAAK
jgi:hypothetical protein